MVRHQAVGQKTRWAFYLGLHHNALKSQVIAVLLKQRQARHRPIEHMVNQTTRDFRCPGPRGNVLVNVLEAGGGIDQVGVEGVDAVLRGLVRSGPEQHIGIIPRT